jgi:hypothetical protein
MHRPTLSAFSRLPDGFTYNAIFCSLGFEERARFVSETFAPRASAQFAIAFPDRRVHSYVENREFYHRRQFTIEELADTELEGWIAEVTQDIERLATTQCRILVDISSMSRTRMAMFVSELCLRLWQKPVRIDFVYALAKFAEKPTESEAPNTHVGPVLPVFAGWTFGADAAPAVVLGLGYEQERALGAVEHIQPGDVWAFKPRSSEAGYIPALLAANESLIELLPPQRILDYDVMQPLDCYGQLESLVAALALEASPIFVPFGPKIFALCTILIAASDRRCAVWRVSAEEGDEPQERKAEGTICGLSILLGERTLENI